LQLFKGEAKSIGFKRISGGNVEVEWGTRVVGVVVDKAPL
jgi:hypothetical protein